MADGIDHFKQQRRFKRSDVDLQVGVLGSLNRFHFEIGKQLGEGGMLLKVFRLYNVGEKLEICFALPGGEFVTAQAQVVYTLEPRPGERYIGICFLQPTQETRMKIRKFIGP